MAQDECEDADSSSFKVAFSHKSEPFLFLCTCSNGEQTSRLCGGSASEKAPFGLNPFLLFLLLWNVSLTFRDNLRGEMSCAVQRVCLTQISRENPFFCSLLRQLNTTTWVYRWTSLCFVCRFSYCGTGSLISLNPPLRHNLSRLPVVCLCAIPWVCVCVCLRPSEPGVWSFVSLGNRFLISSSWNPQSCCVFEHLHLFVLVLLLHLVRLCVLMGSTVPRFFFTPYPTCCTNCPAIFQQ